MAEDIAFRLQRVRHMYGLSQRELAKRAGVTNSSISMIEQGRVSPSISSLEKLLKGIPMTIRDFFNIELNSDNTCFYRSYEMFNKSEGGIDYYCLAEDKKDRRSGLVYEVHEPNSDTGEHMLVFDGERSGFVVQGIAEVTIDSECLKLEPGDGFFIEARRPHRIRNTSTEKSIIVVSSFPPSLASH